ncbi:uncharacterized protein LOC133332001 [Musca vetustissima]|uniref:uncharacterized protein LOC133332001 n=1 Tax=Musca vetustissima TaxID=27455 RepID=UPI002AB6ADC8|nr:uncharacterized protein LOC133332001 [Musca vetustissima]
MKFDGALKPRHGASIEGSSPGAGQLRKYRDKQYPKYICGNVRSECLSEQQQRNQRHHLRYIEHNEGGVNSKQINTTSISSKDCRCKHVYLREQRKQQQQQPSKYHDDAKPRLGSQGAAMMPENIRQPIANTCRIVSINVSPENPLINCGNRDTVAWRQVIGGSGGSVCHVTDAVTIPKQKQQLTITTRQQKQPQHGNKSSYKQTTNSRNNENTKRPDNKLEVHSKLLEIFDWRPLPSASVLVSRLFEQIALLLFCFTFLMPSTGNTVTGGNGGGIRNGCFVSRATNSNRIARIMRTLQSFMASLKRICSKNAFQTRLPLTTTGTSCNTNGALTYLLLCSVAATVLLPQQALADDGDNFFSPNGIVIGETTTEFDYASRGQKKFGDKCDNTLECGFPGSICDTKKKSCQCTEDLPVTNHFDKCGKEAAVNESCFFNEQCEVKYFQTECRDGRCVCRFDMTPVWLKDGSVECKGRQDKKGPETYIDPAMIGVLIGMALMFIIICVVLRLFSQARWRENRTIFNTPNPRLMNVSLLRESKLLHGQERRGSRMSVRAPSRQPSMASLRPHSPNPSLGRMTRSKSNTRSSDSRVSDASNCSRLLEHSHTANTHHHFAHTHPNSSSITIAATSHTSGIHSASVSPHSSNAISPTPTPTLTTNIAYASQSPTTGTACSTNIKPPPSTGNMKPNKY